MFCITYNYNKLKGQTLLLVTLVAVMLISTIAFADTEYTPKIKAAMADMKSAASKLGSPKVEGNFLFLGKTKMNGNFELVDALKTKFGGTATIFIKKGHNYIRITTNVMNGGERAVGTQLDPEGPAIAAIRKGIPYYGIVDIMGKLYDSGYEPIKSANGQILGIYYVGQKIE